MRIFKKLFATSILLTSTAAYSVPVTWSLEDMQLTDQTPVTGSFSFDADTGLYSDINIFGNGNHFTVLGTNAPFSPTVLFAVTAEQGQVFTAPLFIASFLQPLTNFGGETPYLRITFLQCGSADFYKTVPDCTYGTGPNISVASGRVVAPGDGPPASTQLAEPDSMVLFLGAGFVIFALRRRPASRLKSVSRAI